MRRYLPVLALIVVITVLLVGVYAALGGFARSSSNVHERFETALHQRDPAWGSVRWHDEVGYAYDAEVTYHGDAGVHTFDVSVSHNNEGFAWVDKGSSGTSDDSLMAVSFTNDRQNGNVYVQHCHETVKESRLKSLASELEATLYHSIHW